MSVIVVGGGIVGASAAYFLARDGVDVTLIDRADRGHATAAGAGIISPSSSLRPLPAFYVLAGHAYQHYPQMIEMLAEDGQTDTQFAKVGKLFLAQTDEEREKLDDVYTLFSQRLADGMPGLDGLALIDEGQAQAMFPPLGKVTGAIHIPDAARVDGDFLRRALLAGAEKHRAKIIRGSAQVPMMKGPNPIVVVDGEEYEADRLILSGGAWMGEIFESRAKPLSLEPQRGQIVHLDMRPADVSTWPILAGFHDMYHVTFGPHRVVIGATRETGSGFDTRMTMDGLQSVFDHAVRVAPGLAKGSIGEIRVGLRPLSADGLPFIGEMLGDPRIIVATGHGPSGLQSGPYSGLIAGQLATGQPVDLDLSPFAVDRVIQP